jgi:putative ABC transport system permease protein
MSFGELLRDTFRTLWGHKLRTFLTMFGIAWGIISITLMVAAGFGPEVPMGRYAPSLAQTFQFRSAILTGGGLGPEVPLGF